MLCLQVSNSAEQMNWGLSLCVCKNSVTIGKLVGERFGWDELAFACAAFPFPSSASLLFRLSDASVHMMTPKD